MMRQIWRVWFLLAAALIGVGGAHHPGGTMAEMLAHPDWYFSHVLVLGGFIALWLGLRDLRSQATTPPPLARPLFWAIIGVAAHAVEMVVHTIAAVDHAHLVAGQATPILTTHLTMSIVAYPLFGVTLAWFIVAAAQHGVAGSHWFGWVGIIGALAYGSAPPLVLGLGIDAARVLFPLILLVSVWLTLAALWPAPRTAAAAALASSTP